MERIYGRGKGAAVILKGLVLSGLTTTVILLILAFVLLKLEPDANVAQIGILCTYVLSCFMGGMYCGRKMERRKYLWGLLLGTGYFLLLFAVSGMGDRAVTSSLTQGIAAFFLCAGGGMFGGMLG